jgi:hypothetical protein
MKIRIWNAFASNNSGSYTIVGSFDPEIATALAGRLAPVLAAHSDWLERTADARSEESPLARFFREEGVAASPTVGLDDAWPQHGPPPAVIATAHGQVIVHAPYTVTMPRELGALFYARGGRVEIELVHAHHPLVIEATTWMKNGHRETEECARRQGALRAAIEDAALAEPGRAPRLALAWPAAFEPAEWGSTTTLLVPEENELIAVAAVTRELAAAHDLDLRIRISESHVAEGDPLAHRRGAAARPTGS